MNNDPHLIISFFFFNDTATTEIYTLSLHDALPISSKSIQTINRTTKSKSRSSRPGSIRTSPNQISPRSSSNGQTLPASFTKTRSEEHTSELQSPCNLVCRLLLEKKKNNSIILEMVPSPSDVIQQHSYY